jgi:NAD(P)-dependent dehydrogenase (short-subunit alcohol dehydrogenase family)
MARFSGKVAVVTGAGSGVGAIMAQLLVDEGARVAVAGRRLDLLEKVASPLGDAAIAVRADVTDEGDVAELVDAALAAFGQVDVLMNNAAQPGRDLYIWEQTLENWNSVMSIDLTAAMLCSREVIRRSMLDRRTGSIVNFSSTAGWNGMPRKSHYCTAKAALRTLTKVIALEAGPLGIRCNCLVPGSIDTDLYRNWVHRIALEQGVSDEERHAQLVAGSALHTITTPEEVARAALFLASDEARTITGQSIVVDAGQVMAG